MQFRKRSRILIFCVAPFSAGVSASNTIEEVVVTAQKKAESIQDVSIAISAFSGDRLKNLGVFDTRDLANQVPGFSYSDSGYGIPIFTIRGIGFNDNAPTSSSTVGVYIDQASIPYPMMAKGLNLDVHRVEILKGPQGTLYGRNTTGGLVNYISEKPTNELSYGAETSYGRFDKYELEAYVSGPLRSDAVGGRIAYREVRMNEGWQKSLTRPEDTLGEEDKQSARLMLEWIPTSRLTGRLSVNWWKDQSDSQAPQAIVRESADREGQEQRGDLIFHESVRNHPLVPIESNDMRIADWPPLEARHPTSKEGWQVDEEFLMGTLDLEWDISDQLEVVYLGAYQIFDVNGSNFPASGLSVENTEVQSHIDLDAYTHEIRLSGDAFSRSVEWMVGGFYGSDKMDVLQTIFSGTVSTAQVVTEEEANIVVTDILDTTAKQVVKTKAVFGHLEWQTTHYLKTTLGLRYNRERRDFTGCSRDTGDRQGDNNVGLATTFNAISILEGGSGGIGPGDCFTLDDNSDPALFVDDLVEDNVAGRFVLAWTPLDDQLFYGSYTRGYKSGTYRAIANGGATFDQFRPVNQERLDALEIGGKMTLFDRRMQLNFAAFHYSYQDKQLQTFLIDPFFGVLQTLGNIPESKVRGAEIEVRAIPLTGLEVAVAASYIQSEIEEFVGLNSQGEEQDFAGNEFNFTPDWSYTTTLTYQRPLSDQLSVFFGTDFSFTGETKGTLGTDPRFFMDDYTLLNYRLGLKARDERWRATVWGRNVTNEFYVNNIFKTGGDTITRFTGRPQTYGMTLSYQY